MGIERFFEVGKSMDNKYCTFANFLQVVVGTTGIAQCLEGWM